jgi:hypothetical protein
VPVGDGGSVRVRGNRGDHRVRTEGGYAIYSAYSGCHTFVASRRAAGVPAIAMMVVAGLTVAGQTRANPGFERARARYGPGHAERSKHGFEQGFSSGSVRFDRLANGPSVRW